MNEASGNDGRGNEDLGPVMLDLAGAELSAAEAELLRLGLVAHGELMVMTIGEAIGKAGHTNTMKIVRVGDLHAE